MPTTTIKFFAFKHLQGRLQSVSAPVGRLAEKFEALLPDGPEKSAGMRKLLEAKDCFVRSALDMPQPEKQLEPWQARVIEEHNDLVERQRALDVFLSDPHWRLRVTNAEAARLIAQQQAMNTLAVILDERIAAFA